jgi:glutathione S-transferase
MPACVCLQSFMSALKWFERDALTRHSSGPYLLGEAFSLLDIMTISSMERLAAGAGS